jgi:hypothetical protein
MKNISPPHPLGCSTGVFYVRKRCRQNGAREIAAVLIHTGFKEWSVICAALDRGEQIIVLRKGGIAEGKGGFQAEHDEFLLVPTYVHQTLNGLKPGLSIEVPAPPVEASSIRITSLARVANALEVKSLERLMQLRGEHLWSEDVVAERFHRWRRDTVWLLMLRVFRLRDPIVLASHPDYAGCKSWIEFSPPLEIEVVEPVINDDVFEERRQRVLSVLTKS